MIRRKILLQIDNLGSGGAQRQLCLLAERLKTFGHEVTVCVYSQEDHMKYILDRANVRIILIDRSQRLTFFRSYFQFIFNERFDVAISFLDRPNQLLFLATFTGRIKKWISSERNVCSDDTKFSERLWRTIIYSRVHAVVSNSYTQNQWMLRNVYLKGNRLHVIWNGVLPEAATNFVPTPSKSRTMRFVSLGRVGFQKNPQFLVEALKENTITNATFEWYGEEDTESIGLRSKLNQDCERSNLPLRFLQSSKDVVGILQESYCLVLTSRFEGMPNVVLEAMAAGVIVLVPNISDLAILVADGTRGFVFKSGCKKSFREKLLDACKLTSAEYVAMARAARDYVLTECSVDAMARNYERIIMG